MVRGRAMSKPSTKEAANERVFDVIIYVIAAIIIVIVLYPLIFIVSASFSDPTRVLNGEVWSPKGVTLDAYTNILQNEKIWTGYRNTIIYTVVGTVINIIMTILAAYPLSRPDLPGRNAIMVFITLTMFFSGGLIPTYLLVKDLGMVDSMWALIVPGAIATYNLIVMRTYFQSSIPWERRRPPISTAVPTGGAFQYHSPSIQADPGGDGCFMRSATGIHSLMRSSIFVTRICIRFSWCARNFAD